MNETSLVTEQKRNIKEDMILSAFNNLNNSLTDELLKENTLQANSKSLPIHGSVEVTESGCSSGAGNFVQLTEHNTLEYQTEVIVNDIELQKENATMNFQVLPFKEVENEIKTENINENARTVTKASETDISPRDQTLDVEDVESSNLYSSLFVSSNNEGNVLVSSQSIQTSGLKTVFETENMPQSMELLIKDDNSEKQSSSLVQEDLNGERITCTTENLSGVCSKSEEMVFIDTQQQTRRNSSDQQCDDEAFKNVMEETPCRRRSSRIRSIEERKEKEKAQKEVTTKASHKGKDENDKQEKKQKYSKNQQNRSLKKEKLETNIITKEKDIVHTSKSNKVILNEPNTTRMDMLCDSVLTNETKQEISVDVSNEESETLVHEVLIIEEQDSQLSISKKDSETDSELTEKHAKDGFKQENTSIVDLKTDSLGPYEAVEDVKYSDEIREIGTVPMEQQFSPILSNFSKQEGKDLSTENEKSVEVVFTSTKNPSLDLPSAIVRPSVSVSPKFDDFTLKPEKVKSRWRRNSELERGEISGGSTPTYSSESLDGRSPVLATSVKETLTSAVCSLTKDSSGETCDSCELVCKEKPPYYEQIEENIYLFDRRRSKSKKEVRRMICDCSLTKEEKQKGGVGCGEDCLNRLLMIECGSRCPLGESCTNKRFQQKRYIKTEPLKTEMKGWGLKSVEDVPSGSFVMEYVGEVLNPQLFKQRVKQYASDKNSHYYFMALKNDEIIDATTRGNISRFINHSCDPNCETQKWTVNGELRIGFFTRRAVKANEELTFDYQFQRYGKEAQKCFCGAEQCRGFIGEDKQISLKNYNGSKVSTSKRRKTSEDKKRESVEDIAFGEEVEKLSLNGGLRNREQTLMLARLMVRAEDNASREKLLDILKNTSEQACLRLFLDYHGLSLIWSWMVDLGSCVYAQKLKIKILEVLSTLPIPNMTMLLDSKVKSVIQQWASQISGNKSGGESEGGEVETSSEPPSGATTPHNGDGSKPVETYAEMPIKKIKLSEESVSDSEVSDSSPKNANTVTLEQDKYIASPAETAENQNTEEKPCKSDEESQDMAYGVDKKNEVFSMASKLLDSWSDLKEVFRIPRLEQQKRREDEREADRRDRERDHRDSRNYEREHRRERSHSRERSWERDRRRDYSPDRDRGYKDRGRHNRDRYKNESHRSERRRSSISPERKDDRRRSKGNRRNDDFQDKPKRGPLLPTPSMSKEERRQLFAMEIQQKDHEEALRKQQELINFAPGLTYGYDNTSASYAPFFDMNAGFYQGPVPGVLTGRQDSEVIEPPLVSNSDVCSTPIQPLGPELVGGPSAGLSYIPLPGTPQTPHVPEESFVPVLGAPQLPPVSERTGLQSQPPTLLSPTGNFSEITPIPDMTVRPPSLSSPSQPSNIVYQQGGMLYHHPANSVAAPVTYVDPVQPLLPNSSISMPHQTSFLQNRSHYITPDGQPAYYVHPTPPVHPAVPDSSVHIHHNPNPVVHLVSTSAVEDHIGFPPSPPKPVVLPPNWKTAKDKDGNIYYYHAITKQTQWDPPTWDQMEDDLELSSSTGDEPLKTTKKKFATQAAADTSSEVAKKLKELFRTKISSFIVQCLNPYRKPDCTLGRIVSTEDFKHLARKLTHFVMAKELKHCKNVEDLECNESVKHKTKDFIFKYMSKYGPVYTKDKFSASPKDL
ncbi:SET domain containing 2 isoform X2 [Tachypleus tridentatus]